MYNNEIGIYSRKRFHYQSSSVHSRAPLTPSRRPIFSPGGAGQDTARTWGASPVCTRVIPHNARWWARRARETVTTLQWADTRPGRRRVRGWHSRCPGWWLMRMTLALFFVLILAAHRFDYCQDGNLSSAFNKISIWRKWISLPHIKMSGSLTLVWPPATTR